MASIFKAVGSLEKPELVEKKSAPLPPGSVEVADHHFPCPAEWNCQRFLRLNKIHFPES
jgi:hypothetical protein